VECRGRTEIWTIGHWVCQEAAFTRLLRSQGIDLVVDVRTSPGSARSPHFDQEPMQRWLDDSGIGYCHLAALGGRRPTQAVDDVTRNAGWKNASFKNYADYTMTPEYRHGIERLMALAAENRVALLCGEPMPWRCIGSSSPTLWWPAAGSSGTFSVMRNRGCMNWAVGVRHRSSMGMVCWPTRR